MCWKWTTLSAQTIQIYFCFEWLLRILNLRPNFETGGAEHEAQADGGRCSMTNHGYLSQPQSQVECSASTKSSNYFYLKCPDQIMSEKVTKFKHFKITKLFQVLFSLLMVVRSYEKQNNIYSLLKEVSVSFPSQMLAS